MIVLKELIKMTKNAYAPYSKAKISCALEFDKRIIYGVNVENASFGLSSCAERNAIFNAITNSANLKEVIAVHVCVFKKSIFTPCGACRQVLTEHLKMKTPVYCYNRFLDKKVFALGSLLTDKFELKNE